MRLTSFFFKYIKLINLYPPYLGAGIRVTTVGKGRNSFVVEMRQRWYNRNVYGSHFGGSLYAMCDPFYVFAAYSHFGDDYIIWDKSASIKYISPGKGKVSVDITIPVDELIKMKAIVDEKGKATFDFSTKIVDGKGSTVAEVRKEIYIRRK